MGVLPRYVSEPTPDANSPFDSKEMFPLQVFAADHYACEMQSSGSLQTLMVIPTPLETW